MFTGDTLISLPDVDRFSIDDALLEGRATILTLILAGVIFSIKNLHSLSSHIGEFIVGILLLPVARKSRRAAYVRSISLDRPGFEPPRVVGILPDSAES